jgi:hypothetical protein
MSRIARVALVALTLLSVGVLSACGVATQSLPQPTPSATHSGPAVGMPIRPHFAQQADGRALASGWLRRIDLEGGFWALVAGPPGVTTNTPTVIAVLLPGTIGEAEIAQHDGAYLIAEGTLSTGVSIRNAGPEITVDTIRLLGMGQ